MKSKKLDWDELLKVSMLDDVEVEIINPIRKDPFRGDKESVYKRGRLTGFKCGLFGGGNSDYRKPKDEGFSIPHSFDSRKMHYLKKPKVHVTYNIFDYGKKEHSDWVDVDNCIFRVKADQYVLYFNKIMDYGMDHIHIDSKLRTSVDIDKFKEEWIKQASGTSPHNRF